MQPDKRHQPARLPVPDPLSGIDRTGLPVPLPPPGSRLRVAFVGSSGRHRACLPPPSAAIEPLFLPVEGEQPADVLRSAIEAHAPHVTVVFDPAALGEPLPDLGPMALAWVTEPLPFRDRRGVVHPEFDELVAAQRGADYSAFSRVLCADPLVAGGDGAFWRARPLPIADELYGPVSPARRDGAIVLAGRLTAHREHWLTSLRHGFDVVHVADGLGEADRLAPADVALNVHPDQHRLFDPMVAGHLAAGRLLVSEPLRPSHGLEPGIDYLEVESEYEMGTVLYQLRRRPDAYDRVRLRGRAKAELFRASVVWPRILGDLLHDLAAEGQSSSAMPAARRLKTQ